MRVHVNQARRVAVLGVMAALSVVFLLLGTVVPVNTVFFTSGAAFFAGIAVVLYGSGYGVVFYAACGALDFLLNPNKLHVFLYLFLAGYVLLSEIIWKGLAKMPQGKKKEWIHRGIRFGLFACFYVPLVFVAPELVYAGLAKSSWYVPAMLFPGILAWLIFDFAYAICKKFIWEHFHSFWKENERG